MRFFVLLIIAVAAVRAQESWTAWTSWDPSASAATRERERTCTPLGGQPVCNTSPMFQMFENCPTTCASGSFDSSVTTVCSGVCDSASMDVQDTCSNPTTCLFTQRYPCLNAATCTGAWGEWVATGTCSQNCGIGQVQRTRTCLEGGVAAISCLGSLGSTTQTDMADCNIEVCPVIGQWSSLSACSTTCGPGSQQRTRDCLGELAPTVGCFAGNAVRETETTSCNLQQCSQWTEWSDTSVCTATCDTGTVNQQRMCMNGAAVATDCEGSGGQSTQMRTTNCNTFDCNASYSPFIVTTTCNVSCGGGMKAFRSECRLNGLPSNQCNGSDIIIEYRPCSTNPCLYGPYIPQGTCSAFCGGGLVTELSLCTANTGLLDFRCDLTRVVACNTEACVYTAWFDVGTCTEPCNGPGTVGQMRNCSNNAGVRSSTCDEQRTIFCNSQNCSFGAWADTGVCSATCGGGQVGQEQLCLDQGCSLVNNRTVACNTVDCPVVAGAGANIPLLVILVAVAAALLVALATYLLLALCLAGGAKKVTATTAFVINSVQVGSLGMIQWRGKTKLATSSGGSNSGEGDNDIPMVRIFEAGANNSANTVADDEEIQVGVASTYGHVAGLSELNEWAGQMISDSENIKETDVYELNRSNNNFATSGDRDHVTWVHSSSFTAQRPRSTFRPFSRRESSTYTTMK